MIFMEKNRLFERQFAISSYFKLISIELYLAKKIEKIHIFLDKFYQ